MSRALPADAAPLDPRPDAGHPRLRPRRPPAGATSCVTARTSVRAKITRPPNVRPYLHRRTARRLVPAQALRPRPRARRPAQGRRDPQRAATCSTSRSGCTSTSSRRSTTGRSPTRRQLRGQLLVPVRAHHDLDGGAGLVLVLAAGGLPHVPQRARADQPGRPDRLPAVPGRAAAAAARRRLHRRRQAGRLRLEQRRPGDRRRLRRVPVAAHRLGDLGRRGDLHAGAQPPAGPGLDHLSVHHRYWLSSPPATTSSSTRWPGRSCAGGAEGDPASMAASSRRGKRGESAIGAE